jgi:hypothetical protein
MTWRRRLRDIAMAGGLAGCTAQVVGGGSTTGSTSGPGGTSSGTTSSTVGFACNANPDPCCICAAPHYGQGGYGGASCTGTLGPYDAGQPITCADELACMKAPTKECCDALGYLTGIGIAQAACADAGPGPGPGDAGSD